VVALDGHARAEAAAAPKAGRLLAVPKPGVEVSRAGGVGGDSRDQEPRDTR